MIPSEKTGFPSDEEYMERALCEAEAAARDGETPVGALIVWDDGRIVGVGRNRRETKKNALCHAEIEAIGMACSALGGWRLHRATMFVTLEPCPMCAGAILNARIKRVVFAASDPKAGSFGSVVDLAALPNNHRPTVEKGLMEERSAKLLSDFFRELRKKKTE